MKMIFFTLLIILIGTNAAYAASVEITGERASPEHWLTSDGDKTLLTAAQINSLNSQMRAKDFYSVDLAKLPTQLSAADVQALLDKSHRDNEYSVDAPVKVQYAVTVRRADLRLRPLPWNGDNYDDDQATALDPAEAVAVLISSRDDQYVFCRARNYFGWIARDDIAFTDRVTWLSYVAPNDFLVVVDHKKTVNVEGRKQLFQMGAVIPLIQTVQLDQPSKQPAGSPKSIHFNIMIPAFPSVADNHVGSEWLARLPVSFKGRLKEVYVPIVDDETVNRGWLPCSRNNFVRQAFKFLGDEYGWGGLNDSVDCSAFVGDVYRSMGIELPRDANRQEAAMPIVSVFNDVDTVTRYDIVRRAPLGALLFKPGHVMMLLGVDERGTPLAIHAMSSYYANGEQIFERKVIVSDLTYRGREDGPRTIDQLTTVSAVAR